MPALSLQNGQQFIPANYCRIQNVFLRLHLIKKQLNKLMIRITATLLLSVFFITACSETEKVTEVVEAGPDIEMATAVIHPTEGNNAAGTVIFTQTENGVRVQAEISGLQEDSMHGFHIHQYGDCRADDGTSAGGHFNPENMPHGGPDNMQRHVGDLGNLESGSDGTATADFVDSALQLSGVDTILGRGVVLHAGEDDLESQPTGAAGARLGCGVIGVANPEI